MKSEWRETKLGTVAKLRSGFAFKSANWKPEGFPVIKIANVKDGRIIPDGCAFVSETLAAKTEEWITAPEDILIAMTGYVGEVALVQPREKYLINQRVGRFEIIDHAWLSSQFLFYTLRAPEVRTKIEQMARGSAQANLSAGDMANLEVLLPPLPEQRAIAHILGTFDDKIDLLRRQNETLESMARALFQAWFVDFEPVRAKAEGRWQRGESLPGLPAELWDLFPDRLVDSEIGEVPEGWGVRSLGEEFNITMGQSPPGSTYNETGDGLPFYQGRTDFAFRFPTRRVFCTAPKRLANAQDTLVSVRAPVGDMNMASEPCAIGRGVAAVRHKSGSVSYTYHHLYVISALFQEFNSEGTVFGAINKKDFHAIRHIVPPQTIIAAYESQARPLDSQVERNEHESQTLASLRDALLPRLVSGELRVGGEGVE